MKRRLDLLAKTWPTPHKARSMRAADGDATGTGPCALVHFAHACKPRSKPYSHRWQRTATIDGESNEPRRPRVSRCGTLRMGGPVETDARRYQAHTSQCGLVAEYRTFLALARTSVRPAEHSDVTLRIFRTRDASILARLFLVEISKIVTVDTIGLTPGPCVACDSSKHLGHSMLHNVYPPFGCEYKQKQPRRLTWWAWLTLHHRIAPCPPLWAWQ